MNECMHRANYTFLFILLFLYGSSLSITVMIIINNNEYVLTDFFFLTFCVDAGIITLVIFFTILFGLGSFYFSSKEKLLSYIVTLVFMACSRIAILIILFKKVFFEKNNFFIILIYIFSILEIIFCIISIIFSSLARKELIKEIKEAPLNYIDEYITEDIYNNILSQSQNPNSKELREDFMKYINNKKKKYTS